MTATETDYSVDVTIFEPTDPRLGRHKRHDSRSLLFKAPEAPSYGSLRSMRHLSLIPTLDQGEIGSCTANAGTKALSYLPFWSSKAAAAIGGTLSAANEQFAVWLYSQETRIDPYEGTYPPDDTGSDGLSCAKVLKASGLIAGYQHNTSLLSLLTTLQTRATITGSVWRGDMFEPAADGRLSITGNDEGGHEYVYDEIDVGRRIVWIQNSWGEDWGVDGGRAYLTWDDAEELLMADGDSTPFVPLSEPAPVPTPPAPGPTPGPVMDPVAHFLAEAQHWVDLPHSSKVNTHFEKEVQAYLAYLARPTR